MGIVYVSVVIRMRKHFYLGVEGYHVSNDDDDDGISDDHLPIGGVEGSHARE